uniref:Alpha/beta hydrolase n=1 Tax=Ascaris lumbricoides TaxID=6252 RepID=A0A0M3HV82_ASCLU
MNPGPYEGNVLSSADGAGQFEREAAPLKWKGGDIHPIIFGCIQQGPAFIFLDLTCSARNHSDIVLVGAP